MKRILFFGVIVVIFFLIKIDQEFKPENLIELQRIAQEKAGKEIDKKFTTDGCSMFPNEINGIDLTEICIEHDMAYWAGGSEGERREADLKMRDDVNEKIIFLGDLMYWVTRVGGRPDFPAPWRWGYGHNN